MNDPGYAEYMEQQAAGDEAAHLQSEGDAAAAEAEAENAKNEGGTMMDWTEKRTEQDGNSPTVWMLGLGGEWLPFDLEEYVGKRIDAARERDAQTIAGLRGKLSDKGVALSQWVGIASNRLLEIETLTKRVKELERQMQMRDNIMGVSPTEGA